MRFVFKTVHLYFMLYKLSIGESYIKFYQACVNYIWWIKAFYIAWEYFFYSKWNFEHMLIIVFSLNWHKKMPRKLRIYSRLTLVLSSLFDLYLYLWIIVLRYF